MASMTTITCRCGCGRTKKVRTADVKRGWGRYFSKSCKARHQEARTGQYARLQQRQGDDDYDYGHPFASGDEGHGQE